VCTCHAVPTLETVLRTSLKHISFGTMLIECSKNSERVLWSWNCISCLYEEETAIEWINVELLQLLNWMLYIFGTKYGCLLYVCRLKRILCKNRLPNHLSWLNSNLSIYLLSQLLADGSRYHATIWWPGLDLNFVLLKNITNSLVLGGVALCWADFRVGRVLNWIKLY